jgi:hypothetical protein
VVQGCDPVNRTLLQLTSPLPHEKEHDLCRKRF